MRYHYQIVSSFDPTDIPVDSRNYGTKEGYVEQFDGYNSYQDADEAGEFEMIDKNLNSDQYYVKVIPVPENVVEEDELDGHCYPGHETWND